MQRHPIDLSNDIRGFEARLASGSKGLDDANHAVPEGSIGHRVQNILGIDERRHVGILVHVPIHMFTQLALSDDRAALVASRFRRSLPTSPHPRNDAIRHPQHIISMDVATLEHNRRISVQDAARKLHMALGRHQEASAEQLGVITDLCALLVQHVCERCVFQMSKNVEGGFCGRTVLALGCETRRDLAKATVCLCMMQHVMPLWRYSPRAI